MPLTLALGSSRQEDGKFETSLDHTGVKLSQKQSTGHGGAYL